MILFNNHKDYVSSFGLEWDNHRKTQLDSYTGLPISRRRFFMTTGWPEDMRSELILEAGSGAGRFTEVIASTGAEVYSFDYSNSITVNMGNNGHYPNVHIFKGDIYNIPLRENYFDRVVCLGVIQHTPEPKKAFFSLLPYLKPGGEIVIDVYSKRFISLLRWKYLLRPITKRIDKVFLYEAIRLLVPFLIPLTIFLRRIAGPAGARLSPIVEYSFLGLPKELNKEWAVLDTFDMYSPVYEFPQSIKAVKSWFAESGLVDCDISYGPNGIVGKGRKP